MSSIASSTLSIATSLPWARKSGPSRPRRVARRAEEPVSDRVDEFDRPLPRFGESAPDRRGEPQVLPAVGFLYRFGGIVEPLDDVPTRAAQVLEQPFVLNLRHAVVHRCYDLRELPRVDEAQPARSRANGHVDPERMDVEHVPSRSNRPLDVPQDVHDVLRLHSSE
jgi:hypothetical protein